MSRYEPSPPKGRVRNETKRGEGGGGALQAVRAALTVRPAGQVRHVVEAALGWYLPVLHLRHLKAPALRL